MSAEPYLIVEHVFAGDVDELEDGAGDVTLRWHVGPVGFSVVEERVVDVVLTLAGIDGTSARHRCKAQEHGQEKALGRHGGAAAVQRPYHNSCEQIREVDVINRDSGDVSSRRM